MSRGYKGTRDRQSANEMFYWPDADLQAHAEVTERLVKAGISRAEAARRAFQEIRDRRRLQLQASVT